MNKICLKAYGKVNLGLDAVGIRADGYHLVNMVMQTVDIYDEVSVREPGPGEGMEDPPVKIVSDSAQIPSDSENLAYRAAALVMEKFSVEQPVEISIKKNIPVAGGMAGGSTDAAAVLKGMNELFELGISPEQMDALALRLGADVPFCLRSGTWFAGGIGEKLKKLRDFPACGVLIVNPGFSVSTGWAYGQMDAPGGRNLKPLCHPDIEGLCGAIESGSLEESCLKMGNIFEEIVFPRYPKLAGIKQDMVEQGALAGLMTGSGATVFGIFKDPAAAEKAEEHFKKDTALSFVRSTVFKFKNTGNGELYGKAGNEL